MRELALALTAAAMIAGDVPASAQTRAPRPGLLRQQIEQRFDVLPLHNGVALRPKSTPGGTRGVRSIELTDGTIAIDGAPATGAELRDKLGADADLVLRLSYLEPAERRALFAAETPPIVETPEAPEAAEAPPPSPPPRRARHSDDRFRIGGSVTVDADESVGDVVVIGGSAHIRGEVTGDIVVVGGVLELGPNAEVAKDVTVVGGTLRRDPTARVAGRVNQIGPGVKFGGLHASRFPFGPMLFWGSAWGGLFAFMSTIVRIAILCLLASLVVLVGHDYVERISARAAAEPLKAGLVGLLAQLLFLPLLIVLVVTIIGILLVPFVVLGVIVVLIVGFTSVSYQVGRFVSGRLGSTPPLNPYSTVIVGILAVLTPVVLGRILGIGGALVFPLALPLLLIGFLAEYLAWTVGFGAVAINQFDKRASSSV
jgi:hypothetical protein